MGNKRRARELPPTVEEQELAGKLWDWMAHWTGDIDELVALGLACINPNATWGLTREGRQLLNKVMPEPFAMWGRVRNLRDTTGSMSPRRLNALPAMWEADNG